MNWLPPAAPRSLSAQSSVVGACPVPAASSLLCGLVDSINGWPEFCLCRCGRVPALPRCHPALGGGMAPDRASDQPQGSRSEDVDLPPAAAFPIVEVATRWCLRSARRPTGGTRYPTSMPRTDLPQVMILHQAEKYVPLCMGQRDERHHRSPAATTERLLDSGTNRTQSSRQMSEFAGSKPGEEIAPLLPSKAGMTPMPCGHHS
jgi:hypothetical protein